MSDGEHVPSTKALRGSEQIPKPEGPPLIVVRPGIRVPEPFRPDDAQNPEDGRQFPPRPVPPQNLILRSGEQLPQPKPIPPSNFDVKTGLKVPQPKK